MTFFAGRSTRAAVSPGHFTSRLFFKFRETGTGQNSEGNSRQRTAKTGKLRGNAEGRMKNEEAAVAAVSRGVRRMQNLRSQISDLRPEWARFRGAGGGNQLQIPDRRLGENGHGK